MSLPDADIVTLDSYARAAGLASRSAAVHHAIRLLQESDLEHDYEAAWDEWVSSGEQAAWGGTTADGLVDAAR